MAIFKSRFILFKIWVCIFTVIKRFLIYQKDYVTSRGAFAPSSGFHPPFRSERDVTTPATRRDVKVLPIGGMQERCGCGGEERSARGSYVLRFVCSNLCYFYAHACYLMIIH